MKLITYSLTFLFFLSFFGKTTAQGAFCRALSRLARYAQTEEALINAARIGIITKNISDSYPKNKTDDIFLLDHDGGFSNNYPSSVPENLFISKPNADISNILTNSNRDLYMGLELTKEGKKVLKQRSEDAKELIKLITPKYKELQVENPEKYTDVYLAKIKQRISTVNIFEFGRKLNIPTSSENDSESIKNFIDNQIVMIDNATVTAKEDAKREREEERLRKKQVEIEEKEAKIAEEKVQDSIKKVYFTPPNTPPVNEAPDKNDSVAESPTSNTGYWIIGILLLVVIGGSVYVLKENGDNNLNPPISDSPKTPPINADFSASPPPPPASNIKRNPGNPHQEIIHEGNNFYIVRNL